MLRVIKLMVICVVALCLAHTIVFAGDVSWEWVPGGILPSDTDLESAHVQPLSQWELNRRYGESSPDAPIFDWRDVDGVNWMTPVKNQGGCGACSAFASLGCLEAVIRIASNDSDLDIDLSEQYIFSCAGGDCPSGLYMGKAFDLIRDNGVPDDDCLPYSEVDDNCNDACPDWATRTETINDWSLLWQYTVDEDQLKSAVLEQPVACYLEVYSDFMSYESGIYEQKSTNYRGGHFVVIVGWNDADNCWICKNSWGTEWGENGYFRIKRGEVSIGTWAMVPDYTSSSVTPTPAPTMTPTPVLKLGVTLEMPATTFAAGDEFSLTARLGNPGQPRNDVVLCVLLEAAGSYWCWPSWKPVTEALDYRLTDVGLGTTVVSILDPFNWPDVPSAGMEFYFWGVMLDDQMTGILGDYHRLGWSY